MRRRRKRKRMKKTKFQSNIRNMKAVGCGGGGGGEEKEELFWLTKKCKQKDEKIANSLELGGRRDYHFGRSHFFCSFHFLRFWLIFSFVLLSSSPFHTSFSSYSSFGGFFCLFYSPSCWTSRRFFSRSTSRNTVAAFEVFPPLRRRPTRPRRQWGNEVEKKRILWMERKKRNTNNLFDGFSSSSSTSSNSSILMNFKDFKKTMRGEDFSIFGLRNLKFISHFGNLLPSSSLFSLSSFSPSSSSSLSSFCSPPASSTSSSFLSGSPSFSFSSSLSTFAAGSSFILSSSSSSSFPLYSFYSPFPPTSSSSPPTSSSSSPPTSSSSPPTSSSSPPTSSSSPPNSSPSPPTSPPPPFPCVASLSSGSMSPAFFPPFLTDCSLAELPPRAKNLLNWYKKNSGEEVGFKSPIHQGIKDIVMSSCSSISEKCLHQLQAPGVLDLNATDVFWMVKRHISLIVNPSCVVETAKYLLSLGWEEGSWTVEDIKKMIRIYPSLCKKSPAMWQKRFKALEDLGLTKGEVLEVGRKSPGILRFGRPEMKIRHLVKAGWFTETEAKTILKKWPKILTLNVERTVKPKILYLTAEMERSCKEIVEFPQYLSYDLRRRIMVRHLAFSYGEKRKKVKLIKKETRNEREIEEENFRRKWLGLNNVEEQVVEKRKDESKTISDVSELLDSLKEEKEVEEEKEEEVWEGGRNEGDSSFPDLRGLLATSDRKFCELFDIRYVELVEGKMDAERKRNLQQIF